MEGGGGVNIIEAEENLKDFQKSYSYGNAEHKMINSQTFFLLGDCVSHVNHEFGIGDISVPVEPKKAIAMHLDEIPKFIDGYVQRVICNMGETDIHV